VTEFIGAIFSDYRKADNAWNLLRNLNTEGSVMLFEMAIVTKDAVGQVSVKQTSHEGSSAKLGGALIGALSGVAGGFLGVGLGGVAGALVGWAADVLNHNNLMKFVDKVSREVEPGGAAVLAALIEHAGTSLDERMTAIGGTVIRE
jgi:uncharacterized membrane protein